MLDKRSTLDLLEREGVAFELAEHPAVFTVEQARQAKVPFAAYGAKNLFLRDDRRRAHYLVCLPDEKRVSLREVQNRIGSRRLSFASETDLAGLLAPCTPATTPRPSFSPRKTSSTCLGVTTSRFALFGCSDRSWAAVCRP